LTRAKWRILYVQTSSTTFSEVKMVISEQIEKGGGPQYPKNGYRHTGADKPDFSGCAGSLGPNNEEQFQGTGVGDREKGEKRQGRAFKSRFWVFYGFL
jgi:hypothetical protein